MYVRTTYLQATVPVVVFDDGDGLLPAQSPDRSCLFPPPSFSFARRIEPSFASRPRLGGIGCYPSTRGLDAGNMGGRYIVHPYSRRG